MTELMQSGEVEEQLKKFCVRKLGHSLPGNFERTHEDTRLPKFFIEYETNHRWTICESRSTRQLTLDPAHNIINVMKCRREALKETVTNV